MGKGLFRWREREVSGVSFSAAESQGLGNLGLGLRPLKKKKAPNRIVNE